MSQAFPSVYLAPELTAKHLRMWGPVAEMARSRGGLVFKDLSQAVSWPGVILVGPTSDVSDAMGLRAAPWVYWDRGYFARFPEVPDPYGYHRLTINAYQQNWVRYGVPYDRVTVATKVLGRPLMRTWRVPMLGDHFLICRPSTSYAAFHGIDVDLDVEYLLDTLSGHKVVQRDKASSRPLASDLENCRAVITWGSNVAVEAVLHGVPVVVTADSAAAPVGRVWWPGRDDLGDVVNTLTEPPRGDWATSLAYGQFTLKEMVEGTAWQILGL